MCMYTFYFIVTYSGDLQKGYGYPRIGLDLRIPKMPINLDFRNRFVRKSGKTVFHVCVNCGSPSALTGMVEVPTDWAGPEDSKNAHKSRFLDPVCPEIRKNRKLMLYLILKLIAS